ncbi:unnamed protein product [Brassica oleracea var. botrytis]
MLPHSYTVDSLSQSQDLASNILAASTPSAISAACSSVESFLHSHTPDQYRHFFSITFPSLICKIFGFGDATAPSPAQSSSPQNGWIDVITATNDSDLSGRVFSLLSPSGILMSSIFAVDKLSLVKYVFPTERLPEYARFMLSSEKDRTALSNLCPFLKGKIEEGASYEVRLNVFEYYMFWLSYYPVCRGNNESSSMNMIPIPKKKMSRLESWTRIKGFPGSSKRDSDQKLECNLYVKILYSYLKAFVPVFDLNAHQPYRSSLLQYGNGYDGSVMARAEFLVNLFVHYWIVENDFSPFPVITAKSFGVAPPFRSAVEEIPPTCGLQEVVKLLVKYLNLSWVTSGVGSENYIEYGESPRWKTPTSGSSFHVANLSLRPLTSWNTHLQRPLYRYILRSFLFCPIGSSIKNASQVFSIWVTYLEPWMISLDDFSDLEAALNGSVKDAKKEESYESRGCGYTSLWQSYVISNYLYYSSLVMHFIGFAHKFLHTDPETITQMVLKVMSILTSYKDLLVLMKNIDKAFHSKQTGPGNSTVNELSRFVPSIREQLKDWEDGLCESNADGSFLHENWNKDLKLFSDCGDGGQQLLQLFILRAEAELQAVPEKNLSEALKCVDSLKQVVSNFFGGHVIKPIAFSLEMDHPQKNRDELFKPRGARNQMASSAKYKGDWMTRPVSEDEVAWVAKLLINISIWLNERLGLNQPVINNDKKENSESVSYVDVSEVDARNVAGAGDAGRMMVRGVVMVCGSVLQLMRKYGVRVNLRVMASKKFLTLLFLYVVFVVLKSDHVMQSQQDTITPFQILGGEAQVVQIMLKSEERVIAKPGSMCYMSGSVEMENTYTPEQEVGVLQWILGKSVSSVVLRNTGQNDGFVGIAAPYLARILPIDLAMFGGEILCQPDAFLCSVNDVKVVNSVDQRARNIVVAGSEGFLRQRLSGQGLAFILAGGSVVQKVLEVGEVLNIDVSCIAALTPSIDVQIKYNNAPLRRAVFGGDNVVMATLTGPGIVFIQSLPFHRLSQRIARSVTSPNMRENPRLLIQIALFAFLAYVVILSSLILTDV